MRPSSKLQLLSPEERKERIKNLAAKLNALGNITHASASDEQQQQQQQQQINNFSFGSSFQNNSSFASQQQSPPGSPSRELFLKNNNNQQTKTFVAFEDDNDDDDDDEDQDGSKNTSPSKTNKLPVKRKSSFCTKGRSFESLRKSRCDAFFSSHTHS